MNLYQSRYIYDEWIIFKRMLWGYKYLQIYIIRNQLPYI